MAPCLRAQFVQCYQRRAPLVVDAYSVVAGQPGGMAEMDPGSVLFRDVMDPIGACDVTTLPCMQLMAPFLLAETGALQSMEDRPNAKEQLALNNIKSFCAGLLKNWAPPLLKDIEAMRGVRSGQDPFTPRRTMRSVCTTARPKSKASVAEKILLKTLGIAHDELGVSACALDQSRIMFDSPWQEGEMKVIAEIFGKSILLNLEGEMDKLMTTST
ncbi:hypothetical protein ZWY2020_014454 [Hordeum vulgare]|nr:hypothetical protein ZWY2020_014454 [Hordeum vulgare]